MPQAAYPKLIKYSTTAGGAGAYSVIDGINTASLTEGGTVLEDTVFETGHSGYMSRLLGLNDVGMSLSGDYSTGAAQIAIRYAKRNRTEIWFQYLPNGTAGIKFRGVVESMEQNGEVNGKEQQSFTIAGDGGLAEV